MIPFCRRAPVAPLALALLAASFAPTSAQHIPTPEEFFGHTMGADRELVPWDQLVSYYDTLGALSDRLIVENVGTSTLGRPFLVIYASAPENLARLGEIQRLNAILQDPRGQPQSQIDRAIRESRVVFLQGYALHSTEVAGALSAAEVAYTFAARNDATMNEILDETVSILVPGMNPDGVDIVHDWYNQWVGTEYEAAQLPELYHHYNGHDNNRDAFMQNTVESQYVATLLFRDWTPQAFIDHHQMGAYTARMSLPPYAEPIRPGADPLVWREMAWYGAQMAYKMDEAELSGAIGAAIYSGWGHFGFHWITPFHNIAGMLTEGAAARLATPLYVHPDQLRGSRQFPVYEEQTTFPNVWEGGWWRVRDVVERQIVATFSPLELAAKNRETILRNAYNKAVRQTRRGEEAEVKAYVIPASQHDPLTMQKMVNRLLLQGVTVERSTREFEHEGRVYAGGTYVVSMAQPKQGVVRWLLGQTNYPDNHYTRDRDGNPIRPYDMTTDNISEFMGVEVHPVGSSVVGPLTRVRDLIDPSGTVSAGAAGYVLDGRLNDSFEAVNLLMAGGAQVSRARIDGDGFRRGDFVVGSGADPIVIRDVAEETGVDFAALATDPGDAVYPLSPQRIAMFQRYYGGNMDEGWTRFMLEDFSFDYTSILDEEILTGNLHERWDVIVLPNDSKVMMVVGGNDPGSVPPEFRSGFGREGVEALEDFVENGGVLVSMSQAGGLVVDEMDVPVRNSIDGVWGNDFWAPGATLRVDVDTSSPFTYGMPERALAAFLANGQVYETQAGAESSDVRRLVTYPARDIRESGWLLGEETIANKAAVVTVEKGAGTIVLLGFRVQHRAQTHGTYKLLFNALLSQPGDATGVSAGGS
ncbi:MAG: M14 family zinc carboxypeptidase [Gemmatimonadota bacterium]